MNMNLLDEPAWHLQLEAQRRKAIENMKQREKS